MITIFAIYFFGYFISLWVMHTFKKELNIDSYDPPHDRYYDDWESNAQAYVVLSFCWPILIFVLIFILIYKLLLTISKKLDSK